MSKAEIQEKIVEIQKRLSDPNSDLNDRSSYASEADYENARKEQEKMIKELEKKYQTAPEQSNLQKVDITEEELKKGLLAILYKEDGQGAVNLVFTDVDVEKGRYNAITCYFYEGYAGLKVGNSNPISQADAERQANELLAKMGVDNMFLNRTVQVKPPSVNNGYCCD